MGKAWQRGFVQQFLISTNCSKFPKKLPKLKVAQKLLKKGQKLLFVTKVALSCSLSLFGLMKKICKFYNKSKISKHFCAILRIGVRVRAPSIGQGGGDLITRK